MPTTAAYVSHVLRDFVRRATGKMLSIADDSSSAKRQVSEATMHPAIATDAGIAICNGRPGSSASCAAA